MPSVYPGQLDQLTNPSDTDTLGTTAVKHSTQHTNSNDAIEAIEATLGVNPQGTSGTVAQRLTTIASTAGLSQADRDTITAAAAFLARDDATSVRDDGDVYTYSTAIGKAQWLSPSASIGVLTTAQAPPGSMLRVDYYLGGALDGPANSYPATRPSSRTDIGFFVVGPNPGPAWLIAGDYRDIV